MRNKEAVVEEPQTEKETDGPRKKNEKMKLKIKCLSEWK
jgi:hypothetical protein